MTKFNYERTYKAADAAYYRLAEKDPLYKTSKRKQLDPDLGSSTGLAKSLMSSPKKQDNSEELGELTLLYNEIKSKNEELKSNIISGES